MKAHEVATLLMETPDAEVVISSGNEWCEVIGVKFTGFHRNAVTFDTHEPCLPGVIIVSPDIS
jgi:hypothetical protein